MSRFYLDIYDEGAADDHEAGEGYNVDPNVWDALPYACPECGSPHRLTGAQLQAGFVCSDCLEGFS